MKGFQRNIKFDLVPVLEAICHGLGNVIDSYRMRLPLSVDPNASRQHLLKRLIRSNAEMTLDRHG